MGIDVHLVGQAPNNGTVQAEMYNPRVDGRQGESSLVVYTVPREVAEAKILPFLNDEFGAAMNQDASFGGTPVQIHNGIDSVLWTGSEITGNDITFDSTNRASSGTNSVRANSPSVGDVWQFAKGSSQDLSGYVALTAQININRRWTTGDSVSIYGWDTGSAAQVGTQVLIEDYIDETLFDTWMSLVIPLSDMGLEGLTVDAFRFEQLSNTGLTGDFFTDVLDLQETGGTTEFRITHDPSKRYEANTMIITITDNIAGTLANGAGMIPLSYDQFMGVGTLSNGILLRSIIDGEISFSGLFTSISDFLAVGFHITNHISDGTNTSITLEQDFRLPLIAQGSPSTNFISFTINDDLSGLLEFKALIRGGEYKQL